MDFRVLAGDIIPGVLGDSAARIRLAGGSEGLRSQVEEQAARLGVKVPWLSGILGKAASAADGVADEEARKAALDEGPGLLAGLLAGVMTPVVLLGGVALLIIGYLFFFYKPRGEG